MSIRARFGRKKLATDTHGFTRIKTRHLIRVHPWLKAFTGRRRYEYLSLEDRYRTTIRCVATAPRDALASRSVTVRAIRLGIEPLRSGSSYTSGRETSARHPHPEVCGNPPRSEEHTSELQSPCNLV